MGQIGGTSCCRGDVSPIMSFVTFGRAMTAAERQEEHARTLGKTQYPKEGVRHEQRSFARGYRISFAGSAADRWRVAAVLFVVVLR
jgi:hypothetical protein